MKQLFEEMLNGITKDLKQSEKYDKNSRVLLIDGLNNFIRIWVMTPTTNDDGVHVGGIVGFLRTLGLAIRTLKPTRVIIAFDGAGGSKRRKKLYPDYKANRGGGTRLNRVHDWQSDDEEKKMMIMQLKRLIQYLKLLPIDIMMIDDIEADDTIAYVATEFFNEDFDNKLYIMSTDKDFYQLLNKNVCIYNPVKKKIIDTSIFTEKYNNILPSNFILLKSLLGDMGDNIPGISGVGEKTAFKALPILNEQHNLNTKDIVSYINNIDSPTKLQEKLKLNVDSFLLNYELIRLDSSVIFSAARFKILDIWNSSAHPVNKIDIIKYMTHDKISSYFSNINMWLDDNFSYINSFLQK